MNKNYTPRLLVLASFVSYQSTKKSAKLALALCFMLFSWHWLSAQTQLEMSVASYPTPPSGSTVANQSATLLENTTGTTFVAFTPAITYTLSFSNQQYTAIPVGQISTGTGLSFGTTLNATAKTAVAAPVVNTLGAIGGGISANHTSNPFGIPGTGIDVATNYGFRIFATTEPLFIANSPRGARYQYGDLTITFNRPVSDPVLHIVGLGGFSGSQGFTMEYEMQTAGYTLFELSGTTNFNVTGNNILNSAPGALSTACGNAANSAACGSVRVTGTNITQLVFRLYVRGDGLGTAWSAATQFAGDASTISVSMNKPVTVSGTVFADANGTTDNIINGTGTNAGGTLSANLVDANGRVVATAPVAAGGTYSFDAIGAGNYTVSLTTTAGVQGTVAPAAALPANYVNTAEGTTAPGDGTVNGTTPITVAAANVTGVNFGINNLPTANNNSILSQTNPGGTTLVAIPSTNFSGTDPDAGGQVTFFKFTAFPSNVTSITINGTSYTAGTFPVGGVTVAASGGALPAGMVSIDPVNGFVTSVIPYKTIDLAGLETAAPANVSIQFTTTLPVYFVDFAIEKNATGVVLTWTTTNEIGNERFDVEKSTDGLQWQIVGSVAAASQNSGTNHYKMIDNALPGKTTFYRIRQVDKDGGFAYSTVLNVSGREMKGGWSVKILPNPVTTTAIIELESEKEEPAFVSIFNNSGVLIQSYTWKKSVGLSRHAIPGIGSLKSGMYYVSVKNKAGATVAYLPFVKE